MGTAFKSYRNLAPQSMSQITDGANQAPNMNEMGFHGKVKDKLLNSMNRSSLPHVKRIINQQVFLEETENFAGLDDETMRRNQFAIDAANNILGYN